MVQNDTEDFWHDILLFLLSYFAIFTVSSNYREQTIFISDAMVFGGSVIREVFVALLFPNPFLHT